MTRSNQRRQSGDNTEVSPDAAETQSVGNLDRTEPEKQVENKKDDLEKVARDALAGQYGYGQERRRRLTELGYDHVAVQRETIRIVNS